MSAWQKQREFIIAHGWFEHHAASLSGDGSILTWRAPGTSICWMRFIINGRFLIVLGDVGDAIYEWSSQITFEWLAGLDGSYFMEKCRASEVGTRFVEWCAVHARSRLNEYFAQHPEASPERARALAEAARDAAADYHDWTRFMHDDDGAFALFGSDYIEYGGIGWIPHLRCVAHLEGLRMAVKQLKDRSIPTSPSSASSASPR